MTNDRKLSVLRGLKPTNMLNLQSQFLNAIEQGKDLLQKGTIDRYPPMTNGIVCARIEGIINHKASLHIVFRWWIKASGFDK